ncbi:MAG: hypothetical protein GY861_11825 [bacterium]|nr:hypothetical protein [bacterium]
MKLTKKELDKKVSDWYMEKYSKWHIDELDKLRKLAKYLQNDTSILHTHELGDGWRDYRKTHIPKDGNEYLLLTRTGIVSGWYCDDEDGCCYVCYDDEFTIELKDILAWMPIPDKPDFI